MKLIFIVSPTLILESPSASTTRGSPSFSMYKNVPEPNFSTTNTLLSQLESPHRFTKICSGRIPIINLSPSETLAEILGIVIFEDP